MHDNTTPNLFSTIAQIMAAENLTIEADMRDLAADNLTVANDMRGLAVMGRLEPHEPGIGHGLGALLMWRL